MSLKKLTDAKSGESVILGMGWKMIVPVDPETIKDEELEDWEKKPNSIIVFHDGSSTPIVERVNNIAEGCYDV